MRKNTPARYHCSFGKLRTLELFPPPPPLPLTRPISTSLLEFQHGAFASKNIRAPEENAIL